MAEEKKAKPCKNGKKVGKKPAKAKRKEHRFISFAVVSAALLAVGGIVSGYTGIVAGSLGITGMALTGTLEILALTFTVFLMCALFFGRLTPVAMLLAGFLLYPIALESALLAGVVMAAFVIAGYGGKLLGEGLGKDFEGEGNLYEKKRVNEIMLFLGLGLLVGAAGNIAKNYFSEFELAVHAWAREIKAGAVQWLEKIAKSVFFWE